MNSNLILAKWDKATQSQRLLGLIRLSKEAAKNHECAAMMRHFGFSMGEDFTNDLYMDCINFWIDMWDAADALEEPLNWHPREEEIVFLAKLLHEDFNRIIEGA